MRKAEYQHPVERRYTISDASVEKLGELLIAHPNGLLLVRDELSGWLWRLESEEHKSERGFYLERWSGKEPIRVDRIGRGSLCGEASCLSIVGGLTPQTLGQLVAGVYSGARNDGMLQRFQLAVYPDSPGPFRNVDREPNREAKERVYRLFARLDSMSADDFRAHDDGEGNFYLRFEPEAQERFNQWRERLEARVRNPNEHEVLVSHLAKYRSLIPELALIFHAIDVADGSQTGPVSAEALTRALMWAEYFEAHARRIYQGAMQPAETAAGVLARRIREQSFPEVFSVRDVMRKCWSGLSRKESVLGALELAEEAGWVRREPASTGTPGRPSERFRVNPKLRA
jgi:putative DNA primase/helicase